MYSSVQLNLKPCRRLYLTLSLPYMHYFFCLCNTGTIPKTKDNKQVLDKLQVERERGITVKAQTASLFYEYKGETYLLNLVDTPVSINNRRWAVSVTTAVSIYNNYYVH